MWIAGRRLAGHDFGRYQPACLLAVADPYAAKAQAVLIKDSDWFAPQLIHSEFRNVLLGAVRRNDVARSDADSFLARAQDVITLSEAPNS
jgi:predicted nucleic acid-binding protein